MKVVINTCYGGFGLSQEAYYKLNEWGIPIIEYPTETEGEVIYCGGLMPDRPDELWDSWIRDIREHPLLVKVVEELGDAANSQYSKLKVVEIPDGVNYTIDEYDGIESIHEAHRQWY